MILHIYEGSLQIPLSLILIVPFQTLYFSLINFFKLKRKNKKRLKKSRSLKKNKNK